MYQSRVVELALCYSEFIIREKLSHNPVRQHYGFF